MKRLIFAVLVLLLLVSCSSTGVITPPQVHELRPGMDRPDVHRVAGTPFRAYPNPHGWEGTVYLYRGRLQPGTDRMVYLYLRNDTLRYIQN